MAIRRREGGLKGDEKRIVKALLAGGMRNQDIQALGASECRRCGHKTSVLQPAHAFTRAMRSF